MEARTNPDRKDATLALERKILNLVREKHGVTGNTIAEQRAARRHARQADEVEEIEEMEEMDYDEE